MHDLFAAMLDARLFSETTLCNAWLTTYTAVFVLGPLQKFDELLLHASLGGWLGKCVHSRLQAMQYLGCRQDVRIQVVCLGVEDGLP